MPMAHRREIEKAHESEILELRLMLMEDAAGWGGLTRHPPYLTLLPDPNEDGPAKPVSLPDPASKPASPEPTVADSSDQHASPSRGVSDVVETTDLPVSDTTTNNRAFQRGEDLILFDSLSSGAS